MKKLTWAVIMAVVTVSAAVNAATIERVTIEDVSSELTSGGFDRQAILTLNGGSGYAGVYASSATSGRFGALDNFRVFEIPSSGTLFIMR